MGNPSEYLVILFDITKGAFFTSKGFSVYRRFVAPTCFPLEVMKTCIRCGNEMSDKSFKIVYSQKKLASGEVKKYDQRRGNVCKYCANKRDKNTREERILSSVAAAACAKSPTLFKMAMWRNW